MKKLFLGIGIGVFCVAGLTLANKITDDNSWLPEDARGATVQVATGIQTNDAHATPKTSPLTVSAATVTITVPDGVAEMIIVHTDNPLRVSEDATLTRYFVAPGGSSVVVPVANTDFIYLARDGASDSIVQFFFNTLEN